MADVPRQYPHVSEIADPKAARSIRLLWDAVSAIQDRTTAVESTTADHTATLATVQSTLTATTILAAQAQPAAAKTTAAIAGGAPVGGDNPPPTSDNGQGADGCTQAGVNGHITPGTVLSPFVIGQVVCGVANEFPTLFDPQPDQPTLDATRTCYMNRVIWHLNLAGFQASHYGSDPTSAGYIYNILVTVPGNGPDAGQYAYRISNYNPTLQLEKTMVFGGFTPGGATTPDGGTADGASC